MTAQLFNQLLRRIGQGDMSALQPIFDEYYKAVESEAAWIISKSEAEDVASEVMLKIIAYAQSNSRAEVKDAGAFVYTVTKRTALDFYRKQKHTESIDGIEQTPSGDEPSSDTALTRATVRSALKQLPETDMRIAVMFYFYDMKIKSIAAELDMTASAVKWHLSEIRKKLHNLIKDQN